MKTVIFKVTVDDQATADALLDELCAVMEHDSGFVSALYSKDATRAERRAAKRDRKRQD